MSELIIQEFGGAHNGNLAKTSARLIKGGSWKRQRIIVILPANSVIPAKCALAMWNLIMPPNNGVVRILCQGLEVGDAYSKSIESVLGHPDLSTWEYILTIEEDNAPPQDGVLKLLEQMEAHPEFSAISGLYFTKGENSCAQIWGSMDDPLVSFRPQIPVADRLIPCRGIGMGFALWRLKTFKDPNLRRPWFVTQKGAQGVSTQDLYFASDANKWGHRFAVDCSCRVGHYEAARDIMW